LAESGAEFLTEESRDVVGKGELHAFYDDVDAVRDDVERLAARVARLAPGART
jgi:ubiquinone biosynthesis protein UbiJ